MSFGINRKRVCHQVQPEAAELQRQLGATIVSKEMEHAVHGMADVAVATRPINTARNYRSKQQQFSDWCVEKNFETGDIVDANKLAFFVYDYVLTRGALNAPLPEPQPKPKITKGQKGQRGRKRKAEAEAEEFNEKEV